jgi:hypothetical protein
MSRLVFQDKVLDEFRKSPKGTIFTNSDFLNYASFGTINKILFRLVEEHEIVRIAEGFYIIPEYSSIIKEFVFPAPGTFALKIADKYSWKIAPTGESALNAMGLSSQISNKYLYMSDGPYRKYEYEGRVIEFRHTTNRSISKFSKEFNLLIQAIKALGKENMNDEYIRKLSIYYKNFVKDDFKIDGKKLPAWIYEEMLIISGEKRSIV